MAGSWSSSSARTSSLGSLGDDDDVVFVMKPDSSASGKGNSVVKFLCSYGGRILPRHSDGALRYVGGNNRVLSLDRSLQFYELQRKLRDMCGWEAMSLRCQLPTEDLDALVSVTSKDDLSNLLEEYDAASRDRLQPLKIRAFLFPRATPPLSPSTSTPSSRPMSAHVRQQHYRQTITPSPAVRLPRQQHYHRRPHQHHAVDTGIQLQ